MAVAVAQAAADGGDADIGAEVIAAGRSLSSAQHQLVRLAHRFDESGQWAWSARTAAHWIAGALDVEVCTAREWIRIGRILARHPRLDEAFGSGRVSYSKIRTLSRVVTPENADDLLRIAESTAAGSLSAALAAWLMRHETPEETDRRQRGARSVRSRVEPDGMIVITARLTPIEGGRVLAAIDHRVRTARTTTFGEDDAPADAPTPLRVVERFPSMAQQRADALVHVVTSGGGAQLTEVILHVRGDGSTLDDGTPISDSVVERIAPTSFLRALIHDAERRPVNASTRRRLPTARQKRVVKERDRCCVDCGATELLEYDHVPPFEVTGRTHTDELQLRCPACHRKRHKDAS